MFTYPFDKGTDIFHFFFRKTDITKNEMMHDSKIHWTIQSYWFHRLLVLHYLKCCTDK